MRSSRVGVARTVRRHRRTLAALAAGLAVLSLGLAMRPPSTATARVLVAARDLPTGHILASADLTVADIAAALRPAGSAADPTAVVGRLLAAPLAAGEPVWPARLVSADGGWATPPGTLPLPVRFSDASAAALLVPGLRVDVVAAGPAGFDDATGGSATARFVAEGVLVLGVVDRAAPDDGLLAQSALADRSPLVILAATRTQALGIAAAQAGSQLSFALAPAAGG